MNSYLKKSLTLIELLIAIVLLSVIILAISNIDLFTRFHTISTDRRAKLQNEVSYVLEHMTKEISKAIGNEGVYGSDSVIDTGAISGNTAIRAYIDANNNGQRETIPGTDYWIAYRFTGTTGADAYQVRYCLECPNNPCAGCTPAWGTAANILSRQIRDFTPTKPGDPGPLNQNNIDIQLTACWDPDEVSYACGTPDNPEVVMRTKIKMPSVSTH